MAEVHRIARVAVWARRDDLVGRDLDAPTAASARHAIASDKKILQITPGQQQASPWHKKWHKNERAVMPRELESDRGQGTQDECLDRRPAQPFLKLAAFVPHGWPMGSPPARPGLSHPDVVFLVESPPL